MCLIVFGWQVHPEFPLVVAANRDEFFARPTQLAGHWPDYPQVMGGIDLEAGGTWLGISQTGRFAAVTNVREPKMPPGRHSRGALTRNFLISDLSTEDYAKAIERNDYAGYNLLLGDGQSLVYCSNRTPAPQVLPAGIYGLSNHVLDSEWPKLVKARQQFSVALESLPDKAGFFELLSDRSIAADQELPNTGVALEWERLLSAVFVQSPDYGTRASSVVLQDNKGMIKLTERSFGPGGELLQASVISTSV
jgi:uncharacterized protein with NRDE domain